MTAAPDAFPEVEPDTKDWTWVLERPCPECGFDAGALSRADMVPMLRSNAEAWLEVLKLPHATTRPSPTVWSPTEYAAHVRDVHEIFAGRTALMLNEDNPEFANWDQDVTAIEKDYAHADPCEVAVELLDNAAVAAATYARVGEGEWERPGRRSNGSIFTVDTLARYHLHDVVHHLWDVDRA